MFCKVSSVGVCLVVSCIAVFGQAPPPVILEVQVENAVQYASDVSDASRFATDPGITTSAAVRNFGTSVAIADIVSVNGKAVKGTAIISQRFINLRTAATPGLAIADTVRNAISSYTLEILQTDGTRIGSIFASGLSAGAGPPGAPLIVASSNVAVVGGTGAFLGAHGQLGARTAPMPFRTASVTEDPANRRSHGGGRFTIVAHLLPLVTPEILSTATGPEVLHPDFTPVTATNPATAGESLTLIASGLGPTRPGIDPGKAFPTDSTYHHVNSPLEVIFDGKAAQIINKIGEPGSIGLYRIDFRVPQGTASGTLTIQLIAAWIAGSEVKIAVR